MSDTLRSKLMVGRHTLPNALMLLVPCQSLCLIVHCTLMQEMIASGAETVAFSDTFMGDEVPSCAGARTPVRAY